MVVLWNFIGKPWEKCENHRKTLGNLCVFHGILNWIYLLVIKQWQWKIPELNGGFNRDGIETRGNLGYQKGWDDMPDIPIKIT